MGKGSGYGKVILFNEHFVVHGIPAVASAIRLATDAIVKRLDSGSGITIHDERMGTEGYSEAKREHQREALERMMRMMGVNTSKMALDVTGGGELPTFSGIGASAANCVAVARGVSDEFGMGLPDDRINEIAYEGERAFAGNPSGIDNTAATYGGLVWFKRGEQNVIERLKIKQPVEIVMGNTGVVANTKEVVAGVRERKEKYPDKYSKIFKEAEELVHRARKALEDFDLETVGEYMNQNHAQLQAIEVSSEVLNRLVDIARDHGAPGAKMTGGGRGGCMVALTPGKDLQETVAQAMEKEGFVALRTTIG